MQKGSIFVINDLRNRRVTVMGLGRFGGGVGVTRWLVDQGAHVTISDQLPPDKLQDALARVSDLDVELDLGGHTPSQFTDTDLVVANPAVPPNSNLLAQARDHNVPITTEINLFVQRCPAQRVIGVTGSTGKSTVTAMIDHILSDVVQHKRVSASSDNIRRNWVGGNLGGSLLPHLDEMHAEDVVVLELSSFQLHYTPLIRWSPNIAVLTNLAPNHLDWHGTYANYVADKMNSIRFQNPASDAIVIHDAETLREPFMLMFGELSGIWRFDVDTQTREPTAVKMSAASIDCDDRWLRWRDVTLMVPGAHNRLNAAAALTVAHELGLDEAAAIAALASFPGLPHRLQPVPGPQEMTCFDDSKSTSPDAVRTALEAVEDPVAIIIGGYDKQLDLTPLVEVVAARCTFAACVGQTGPTLSSALTGRGIRNQRCTSIEEGVTACASALERRGTLLLSPGCASWDMFPDYRARGAAFANAVARL